MNKKLKYFGISILAFSVLAACEETVEPEKDETAAPVVEKEEVKEDTKNEESPSVSQQTTIEAFESGDFMTFAESFYALEADERSAVYRSTVEGSVVNWTGIITDLDTISDSVVVLGKGDDAYTGADWNTLNSDYKELLPYVIVVEMNEPSVKSTISVGQHVTLTGEIGARGDVDTGSNWKVYHGEISE